LELPGKGFNVAEGVLAAPNLVLIDNLLEVSSSSSFLAEFEHFTDMKIFFSSYTQAA
jgi:hypothetical protein